MLNLSDLLVYYIEYTFHEVKKKVIYSSFAMLEMFGVQFYEDKFVDLLSRRDDIDNNTKMDNFVALLQRDVYEVIQAHGIELQAGTSLRECNCVLNFLYLVQNLDDYDQITSVLYSDLPERQIVSHLIQKLTPMSLVECMEAIESVSPGLIESLKKLIEDRSPSTEEVDIDLAHRKHLQAFFDFTGKTECLGMSLYEKGFVTLTLQELIDLVPMSVDEHIDNLMLTNVPQATLDVLSLLVITKDNYQNPLEKFNQNTHLLSSKPENVTRLGNTLKHMLTDFDQFMEMIRQKEKLHVNQA